MSATLSSPSKLRPPIEVGLFAHIEGDRFTRGMLQLPNSQWWGECTVSGGGRTVESSFQSMCLCLLVILITPLGFLVTREMCTPFAKTQGWREPELQARLCGFKVPPELRAPQQKRGLYWVCVRVLARVQSAECCPCKITGPCLRT